MPRIKKRIEEEGEIEEEEEEQFEEDELEKEPTPLETKGRVKSKKKAEPEEPKRRFGVVAPQPLRLVDAETEEVVGEGDYLVATTLADILERLERIENSIGSMLEG